MTLLRPGKLMQVLEQSRLWDADPNASEGKLGWSDDLREHQLCLVVSSPATPAAAYALVLTCDGLHWVYAMNLIGA